MENLKIELILMINAFVKGFFMGVAISYYLEKTPTLEYVLNTGIYIGSCLGLVSVLYFAIKSITKFKNIEL